MAYQGSSVVHVVELAEEAEARGVAEVLKGHKGPAFRCQMDAAKEEVLAVPVVLPLVCCKDHFGSHHAPVSMVQERQKRPSMVAKETCHKWNK